MSSHKREDRTSSIMNHSKKKHLNVYDAQLFKASTRRKSLQDYGLLKANWDQALNFRKRQSNRQQKGQNISFFVSTNHFKQYGPGTYLFFLFADKLMKIFIIMSLLSIPAIYSNYSGDGMNSIGSSGVQSILMGFSFGNQLTNSTFYSTSAYQKQMKSHYRMVIIPDFVYSLVFLIFLFYWQHQTNRIVKQLKQQSQLPSYFCLTITNIPQNTNQNQIKYYMQQFGEVKEVAQVRNYDETISLSKKIYEKTVKIREERLMPPNEMDHKKIAQIKSQVDEYFEQLGKHYFHGNVFMYFVSFKSSQQRDQAVQKIASYSRFKHDSAVCCGCKSIVPQQLLIQGQLPKLQYCTVQPGSIIWQNIHLSGCSRFTRWIIQTIFIIIASILAFFLLSLINIATPQYTPSNFDASSLTYAQILLRSNETITQAWCLSQSSTDVYTSSTILSTCWKYLSNYYSSLGIQVGISLGVVLIKLILQKIVGYISKFQRPSSYSQHTSSLAINYFCVYFITTFVLTILLQAQIAGFSFKDIIGKVLSNDYLISNSNKLLSYTDFTRLWYNAIGYKICITWIISSLIPHIYDPLIELIIQKINQSRAQNQRIQKTMNEIINPPQFAFELHYANMLLIVFGALVLGGPIPFLLIFATIALATKLIYWRIMFIRFSRIPPTFDESLNNTILKILPWALILHCAFSIYAYGADNIFYDKLSLGMTLPQSYYSTLANLNSSPFLKIVLQRMSLSFFMTVVGCLCLIVTLIKLFFYDSIVYLVQLCKSNEPVKLTAKPMMVIDEDKNFIKSYLIEKNYNYQEIVSIIKSVEFKNQQNQP